MKLYNTLTRTKEELCPLNPGQVKIYTCGLTVYSQPHIGNWVGYIYWDVLVRTLTALGLEVQRTQNITDVGHLVSDDDSGEDKLQAGANREGVTAWDIAEKYAAIANHEAYDVLRLVKPTHLLAATASIPQQIAFAKVLDAKGYLYEIPDEGMYFDTSKLAQYGQLARLDIQGLDAGSRVTVEGKRTITDFAVWKYSPKQATRDMEWDSPWGKGFPGWHLECSVIARETLGDRIDIHTGGIDHIPVHHTNEIAQTEAVTGQPFSQIWMHNNHLKIDGEKISKSLGNILTLDDLRTKGFSADTFKVFVLTKHYRTEGNFSWANLQAAQQRLLHWREAFGLLWQIDTIYMQDNLKAAEAFKTEIMTSLEDDLATPAALQVIDVAAADILEGHYSPESIRSIAETIGSLLGISVIPPDISDDLRALVSEREEARQQKDWAQADNIRQTFQTAHIGLRDGPKGAMWYWINEPTIEDS